MDAPNRTGDYSHTNITHTPQDTIKSYFTTFQDGVKDIARRVLLNPLVHTTLCTSSLAAFAIAVIRKPFIMPASAIAIIAIVGLMCLGIMAYQQRKRILFEISLTYNIALNALKPESYHWWDKIDDKVTLGAVPLKNKGHLKAINADAILACIEDFELKASCLFGVPVRPNEWKDKGVDFHQIQAQDFKPLTFEEIDEGVQFMDKHVRAGKNVYVHCKAGRGRSATVVLCYYVRHKNMTADQAIKFVQGKRNQISLSENQIKAVKDYEAKIRPSATASII